ncbi:hypothetical protein NOVOSPHI9U_130004 [Novosphingobium sp. 9U]|nr:hypothetical protein NOVOSPHI9U_130004 [Novosphingobium sp. 9U]
MPFAIMLAFSFPLLNLSFEELPAFSRNHLEPERRNGPKRSCLDPLVLHHGRWAYTTRGPSAFR